MKFKIDGYGNKRPISESEEERNFLIEIDDRSRAEYAWREFGYLVGSILLMVAVGSCGHYQDKARKLGKENSSLVQQVGTLRNHLGSLEKSFGETK